MVIVGSGKTSVAYLYLYTNFYKGHFLLQGSVPEFAYSHLHFSIMVFIDLLQSPFQSLQFRPPFPLQSANGLRHS